MSLSCQSVWQKVLAKDVLYNNYRFPNTQYSNHYQLKNLYLKRRTQLSRDSFQDKSIVNQDPQVRYNYYILRQNILSKKYGVLYTSNTNSIKSKSRTSSLQSLNRLNTILMDIDLSDGSSPITNSSHKIRKVGEVVPTENAIVSRALAGNDSIAEGYAFAGIKHIFDHSKGVIYRIRFTHNDASRLAVASEDGSVSICKTLPATQECVLAILRDDGSSNISSAVTDLAWSSANDFLISSSRDGCVRLWNIDNLSLARVYKVARDNIEVLCLDFQPINNNFFVCGCSDGIVQLMNLSTGKPANGGKDKLGGRITAVEYEQATGLCLWVGNSFGIIQSYLCEPSTGRISRARRLSVSSQTPCYISSLQARAWISREARDPCLLASVVPGGLYFFRITSSNGQLVLKNKFPLPNYPNSDASHPTNTMRASFCPLISFRQGACVVCGSSDGNVRVFDVTSGQLNSRKQCLTMLQGHCGCVIDVAISCDEQVMASCDDNGQVILWKRSSDESSNDNNNHLDEDDLENQ